MVYGFVASPVGALKLKARRGRGQRSDTASPRADGGEKPIASGSRTASVSGDKLVLVLEDEAAVRQPSANSCTCWAI